MSNYNDNQPSDGQGPARDWQPVIVAGTGLFIVGVITLIAVLAFPGSVPQGQVNTTGQNVVSVATAAITAVAAVVGAYFGVKSANSAREDTAQRLDAARTQTITALKEAHESAQAASRRNEITISTMAGALTGDQASDILQTADGRPAHQSRRAMSPRFPSPKQNEYLVVGHQDCAPDGLLAR
jgi:hypothetical protein